MKKMLGAFLTVVLIFAFVGVGMAEEYFPPPADGKGVIGGRNAEEWRLGYFEGLVLDGVTYDWPAADGTATYQLTTDGSGTLSWAAAGGGTTTDFALTADADAGDKDIKSLDKLEFYDAGLYIDGGADGVLEIKSDGTLAIDTGDWDISTTGVITNAAMSADQLTDGDITLSTGSLVLTAGDLTVGGTLYESAIAPATGSLTVNASGAGTISIGNASTGAIALTGGGVDIGDGATDTLTITGIVDSDVTLDDGTTDSPKMIFKDSDDEQAEIYQDQSSDDLLVECNDASDSLAVTVGNLSAGEPNVNTITLNGDDLYVADDAEIDGTLAVDGDLDVNGNSNFTDTATMATVAIGTLLDVNEEVDIDLDANDEEISVTSTATDYAAGSGIVTVYDDSAGQTNASYLARFAREADGDAQDHFILCEDNSTGAADNGDDMFKVDSGGAVTAAGTITGTGTITGATIQATTLLDVNEDVDVDFDAADEEISITNSVELDDDLAQVTISNTDSDLTDGDLAANMYLLRLEYTDDGDADGAFIVCEDNGDDELFVVDAGGEVTAEGDINANGNITGDGATEMVGVRHDVVDAGATNPYTVTAAMSGTVFINSQAVEFDLPADPTGLEFTFIVHNASNLDIDPNGTDRFPSPITGADGDYLRSSTVGDSITIIGINATTWYVKSAYPASTDWAEE